MNIEIIGGDSATQKAVQDKLAGRGFKAEVPSATAKTTNKEITPKVFTSFPMGSILQKSEAETIASNIMRIRARTGDKWEITWEQYKAERLKDAGFSEIERPYFDQVLPLISDFIGAIGFAPSWGRDAKKFLAV